MLEQYHRYIDAVLSGEVLTCEYVRLAVERQVRDLERQESDEAWCDGLGFGHAA